MSNLIESANAIAEKTNDIHLRFQYFEDRKMLVVSNSTIDEGKKSFKNMDIEILRLDCILPKDCTKLFANIPFTDIEYGLNFDSSNVVNATSMFEGSHISEIKFSQWNLSNLECMDDMFYECPWLVVANFAQAKFPKLQKASCTFYKCDKLAFVDLADVDMSHVYRLNQMFSGCSELMAIRTHNWSVYRGALTLGIFEGCDKLDRRFLPTWAREEACWYT